MISFTEFLKNENLTIQDRKFYIEIIESNSKKLLNFIDNLVDISKIQSNSLKPIIGECHLSKLIKNLEDKFNHIKKLIRKRKSSYKQRMLYQIKRRNVIK